jgi:TRAP-type C4-dicarboxylate transport system permease small subunit
MAESSWKQRIEVERIALDRMASLLIMLLLFLLLLVLIGGAGIGIGFLLHWLFPAIGIDIGSLIGVVTLSWTISFFARLVSAVLATKPDHDDLGAADSEIETIILKPMRRRRAAKRKS